MVRRCNNAGLIRIFYAFAASVKMSQPEASEPLFAPCLHFRSQMWRRGRTPTDMRVPVRSRKEMKRFVINLRWRFFSKVDIFRQTAPGVDNSGGNASKVVRKFILLLYIEDIFNIYMSGSMFATF